MCNSIFFVIFFHGFVRVEISCDILPRRRDGSAKWVSSFVSGLASHSKCLISFFALADFAFYRLKGSLEGQDEASILTPPADWADFLLAEGFEPGDQRIREQHFSIPKIWPKMEILCASFWFFRYSAYWRTCKSGPSLFIPPPPGLSP